MLEFLKKFFVTILVLLLVVSFAVWGISDTFFGTGKNYVLKIENQKIYKEDIERRIRPELNKFSQLYKGNLPDYLVRQIFMGEINNITNEIIFSLFVKDLKIFIDKSVLVEQIKSMPIFADEKGNFSQEKFEEILNLTNLNLNNILKDHEDSLQQSIAISAFTSNIPVENNYYPENLTKLFLEHEFEKRKIEMIEVPLSYKDSFKIKNPTEDQLTSFYNTHSEKFISPEYRKVEYIKFSQDVVKEKVAVSEEEIESLYEENYKDFKEVEERELLQIFFDDEEKAKKAREKLLDDEDFFVVAEKSGQNKEETLYGFVTKSELVSQALLTKEIIDGIFVLEEDEFTRPLKSSLGWHIFSIKEVREKKKPKYEDEKANLAKTIKEQKIYDLSQAKLEKIDDFVQKGASLQEIAGNLDLEYKKTPLIDNQARILNDSGEKDEINQFPKLIEIAFLLNENELSDFIFEDNEKNIYLAKLIEILPPRVRNLDEVKGKVKEAYIKNQKLEKLKDYIDDLHEKIIAKEDLNSLSDYVKQASLNKNFEFLELDISRRANIYEQFNAQIVSNIYNANKNDIIDVQELKNGNFAVIKIKDIYIAVPENTQNITKNLQQELDNEILDELISYLKTKYDIKYNLDAI